MKAMLVLLLLMPVISSAVVGGKTLTDGSFRQTVALTYKALPNQSQGEVYCSGTLIGPRLVLTAAHCISLGAKAFKVTKEEFAQRTWIYIGDSPVEAKPMATPQFKVQRAVIYPPSDASHSDLAVLVLEQEVNLENYQIRPAPLMIAGKSLIGRELTHVGFGQTESKGPKGEKAAFSLPIRGLNGYNGLEVGEMFKPSPGACHGDSGGSAYVTDVDGKMKFVGVENAISNHPCGEAATFFVPVSENMLRWIRALNMPLFE
ncbi:S1 family peptidase [Bdellovibrio bacteriovorus]|nr:trypsin-like serine protease [Bdellovibrio bacteriovorus]